MPVRDPANDSSLPLRVLCVIANPSDLPPFDDRGLWREMTDALQPLMTRGSLVLERVADPTDPRLRRKLAETNWHVLHLIVHGEERGANYGTIALNSSDGRARRLTAKYLASLLSGNASIRMIVLQAADEASRGFEVVANALADHISAVITVPPIRQRTARIFVSKLYTSLLEGLNAHAVIKEVQTALTKEGLGAGAIQLHSQNSAQAIFSMKKHLPSVSTVVQSKVAVLSDELQGQAHPPWHEELQIKRTMGQFDVFLCHNSADKPAVKRIAEQLKEAGILPWLDIWELPPGLPWQPLLEQQIGNIKSAAVFVGSAGFGPWQEQELNAFLRAFVKRRIPVIPVMLADAPAQPELPPFLEGMVWVDFRCDDPDPITMLTWGITGKRPDD